MKDSTAENWQYREYWIKKQFQEQGWSKKEIKRGERYRKSTKYIVTGAVWSMFIIPAPIGFLLFAYGTYLRYRHNVLGEEYVSKRIALKSEFNRQGLTEPAGDWDIEGREWRDRVPIPDWW
ncbi:MULTISPECIES: hypothetical protein [Natrialbaceae]|uniref:hypothetical protein n=1 Tax=Natrialbaceae TaxID=1644061 RepID=UPI00207C2580|nr:hypothetical protein [Natronococcus sp. CG52]